MYLYLGTYTRSKCIEVLSLLFTAFHLYSLRQVLVKIGAAGINPVETYIRSGGHARKPALPYTPGSDGAGVVHRVGDGVTQFQVSDIISEA